MPSCRSQDGGSGVGSVGAADAPDLDLNLDFVDNEWIRELFSDTGLVTVHVTS